MERKTIYCTEKQTKKALKLGAPIKIETRHVGGFMLGLFHIEKHYVNPTAEQMTEWLEEQGVKCFVLPDIYDDDSYNIQINKELIRTGHPRYNYPLSYNSRKEATLTAIDKALEYLIDNRK